MKLAFGVLILALAAPPQTPQHGHGDRFGNPSNLDAYIAALEDPARDAWQKPDAVLKALGLAPGQTACDIGAGPGYFSLRLAKAVGPTGHVWAVDVEPVILAALRERVEQAGIRNLTPVLAIARDPLLPPSACDLALIVNTYHHFQDGPDYLRRLAQALRPGGRIVNIDYQKKETPVGPPQSHRISREEFLADAARAGLTRVEEPELLPYQYVVVLKLRAH